MAEAEIIKLRPKFQELRDARTYTAAQVKELMFHFARDLGIKWRADKLRRFIETAFDFD